MPTRTAFTLLELLLTLAIVAAITAVTIPQMSLLLGDRRLVRGGDQLRAEMTRLRVDSMRKGRVMMMEGTLQGSSLRIKPFFSDTDATEALDQTGSQSSLLSGAKQGIVTAIQTDQTERDVELPTDVVVESVAVASAARSIEVERLTSANQVEGWSQPILFYPDGSTSTAVITLSSESMGRVMVRLRGITGDVTVSEVVP